jgi:HME family heavy-metal exporter
MFTFIVTHALKNRLSVLVAAGLLVVFGVLTAARLPVDVFPDLNRPTVTIMTEAEGLAPQEAWQLVTFPIETQMNGPPASGRVRSVSGGALIIYVEFAWGTEIFRNRQQVPSGLRWCKPASRQYGSPQMGPINSIMGQILPRRHDRAGGVSPMSVREIADFVVARACSLFPAWRRSSRWVASASPRSANSAALRIWHHLRAAGEALAQFGSNTGGGFTDQYAQNS